MNVYKDKPNQTEVFYDGECALCQALVSRIHDSSRNTKFATKDVTKGFLPENTSKENALNEMFVTDETGIYRNANAILKILERYPQFSLVVAIGRLPIINQIMTVGYFFVSSHRHYWFGQISRIVWLKFLTVLALLSGILLSLPLWLQPRSFPEVPLFSFTENLPPFVGMLGLVGMLACLILGFFISRPNKYFLLFFLFAVVLCSMDQMRLQPWFYQYAFMLLLLSAFSWKKEDCRGIASTVGALRIIIASIYFYSGLQKLNPHFVTEVFPWVIDPLSQYFEGSPYFGITLIWIGSLVPLIEMGIGLGLLTHRFRKLAIYLALMMFLFLIPTIGPLGYGWNPVVWPWNIAMIMFVFILFWRRGSSNSRAGLRAWTFSQATWVQRIVVFLFLVMPALSFFGLWDSYPSFSLYSGNTTTGSVSLSSDSAENLPGEMQKYIVDRNGSREVLLRSWSFSELGVPVYPEERVYLGIFKHFCDRLSGDASLKLLVDRRAVFNTSKSTDYSCTDL